MVAQPGSALAWGARGRWFESSPPDKSLTALKCFINKCFKAFFIASFLRPLYLDPSKTLFGSQMGYTLKTPKGEISITDCWGRIRLRWRYTGERYSLNLPFAFKPENLHLATVKITEIKLYSSLFQFMAGYRCSQ